MNRARLRTLEVVAIRKQARAGYAIGELAKAYGRTVRTIGRVVSGESYGHIDGDAIDAAPPLPQNIGLGQSDGQAVAYEPTGRAARPPCASASADEVLPPGQRDGRPEVRGDGAQQERRVRGDHRGNRKV